MADEPLRLPDPWSMHVESGVLNAISLASVDLSYARGRATGKARLRAELDQALTEVALLREELSIKDGHWERAPQRRRPHCLPTSRLRILQLRAARGWTLEKTARVFLIDVQTLSEWIRRAVAKHYTRTPSRRNPSLAALEPRIKCRASKRTRRLWESRQEWDFSKFRHFPAAV